MSPFTIACTCRALPVLALAAACAQCGASCVDNDSKIIQLFGGQGVTVSGCTDAPVKADCGAAIPEDAIPARTTKVVCCSTCFEINAPGLKKQSGVQYTTAYGLPWVLDIVEPEDTGVMLPLAVIVHGGGFKGGARISNEVWAIDWANRGYRVINVDYPLCKHYWRGTDQQQHPWGATASLTDSVHPDCAGGLPDAEAPAWFSMNMAEVASRAVRHAVKWAHDEAAEGMLNIDTANTVCHGSSAGSLTCLQTFLYNTTVSYANELAAAEQAAAGLPQQTNLLSPDPGLDYIKLAAHVGMSFGDLRNITQETVDAMAPGASAWVIHDWKDEWQPVTGLQGEKMAGVRNLGRMLNEFGISNTVYVLDDPGTPRGPPGGPYMMKQHGLDLEKTLQGDVLEGMHTFVAQGLASATRDPAPGVTSPTGQTTDQITQPTGQTTQPTGQTTQPTGQTTQTTVCTDNDAAIIALATAAGIAVTGCADVKVVQHCSEFAQVPIKCCASCAAGQSSSSATFAASLGGNPFTGDPDGGAASSATQHRGVRLVSVMAAALAAIAALCLC